MRRRIRWRSCSTLLLGVWGWLAWTAGPAWAHGGGPVGPDTIWLFWNLDPLVLGPLALVHWLYGRGTLRLAARRGEGPPRREVACFLAAEAALVVALVSPLEALSGTLLSAHMAQHIILIAVAPPLFLLARPAPALAWSLPRPWRRALGRSAIRRRLSGLLRWLERPSIAALLHGLAIWGWHVPGAFEAAAGNWWLHHLEHLSFFGTALLFWRAVLGARAPAALASAALAALVTMAHGGLLGALLTFAGRPLYPGQGYWTWLWGLTPLEDQQLAGLLMWVPCGLAYLAAAVLLASRFFATQAADAAGVRAPGR